MPLPKGRTNNPHGRPRKSNSLTEALRKYVFDKKKLTIPGFTNLNARDALIEQLYKMGLHGDFAAIKYIIDRLDGKPIETLEVGSLNVIQSLQKELFDFDEESGAGAAGDLEPPEETSGSAEE